LDSLSRTAWRRHRPHTSSTTVPQKTSAQAGHTASFPFRSICSTHTRTHSAGPLQAQKPAGAQPATVQPVQRLPYSRNFPFGRQYVLISHRAQPPHQHVHRACHTSCQHIPHILVPVARTISTPTGCVRFPVKTPHCPIAGRQSRFDIPNFSSGRSREGDLAVFQLVRIV